jgi:hypothetical protein
MFLIAVRRSRGRASQGSPPSRMPTATPGRRPTALQCPPHRPRVHAELLRDVTEVDAAFDQCLNRHEVLQSQHAVPPPDVAIGEGTFSLVFGGLPISAFSRLLPSALTPRDDLAFSGVHAGTDLDAEWADGIPRRRGASDRAGRAIEGLRVLTPVPGCDGTADRTRRHLTFTPSRHRLMLIP